MKIPEVELYKSVICRALLDACTKNPSPEREEARNFLRGGSQGWKESREYCCLIAGYSVTKLDKLTQEWDKIGWPILKKPKEFNEL